MRNIIVGAIALAIGCTSGQQERKSDTLTAQEQATQEFQRAADAQKRAADEQARAEKAQSDVTAAQRALADAQTRLRSQRAKAEQAQRDAQMLAQEAHQRGVEAQQEAVQRQSLQYQRGQALAQNPSSWSQPQQIQGSVIGAQGNQLSLRTADQQTLWLDVTDSTALRLDGRAASLNQIQPGADVRASYQLVDGQAQALQIDATSNRPLPEQDQGTRPPPPVDAPNPMR